MAKNKRQHYVPQFYLRAFSPDSKNIWVYNLKQDKVFLGPIKTVCAESYFYGKDTEQETSLAPLEGKAAGIIRNLVSSRSIPTALLERFYLLTFMMLQHGRTAAARDAAKRHTQKYSDLLTQLAGVSDVKLVWKADHAYNMLVSMTGTPLIIDLEAALIVNDTRHSFIVSDSPVVFHNTKFNRIKSHGTKGFQSRGLQIFWPITQTLCLLLYDPSCYEIPSKTDQTVNVDSESDIDSINSLQYLYCRELLLFASETEENYIREIGKNVGRFRKENTEVMTRHPHPTKSNAEIAHFYSENLDYELQLGFVQTKDGVELGVRNAQHIEHYKKFFNELMERSKSAKQDATP